MSPLQLFRHEAAARNAILICCAAGLILPFADQSPRSDALINLPYPDVFMAVYNGLQTTLIIYLTHILRHNRLPGINETPTVEPVGTWGYIWRTMTGWIVATGIVVTVAISISLILTGGQKQPLSTPGLLLLYTGGLFSCIPACWLLFSYNRRDQLRWAISVVRDH